MPMKSSFIRQLHATGTRIVLAVTGGGSGAISALLEVPGASQTVLEAVVPYSAQALADWLGATPEQFSSARTARSMAMAGYQRALRYARLEQQPGPVAGVACTASLASNRPKRGPHRIHAAWQTASVTAEWSLELVKGHRARIEEERIAAAAVLNMAAQACGLDEQIKLALLDEEQPASASVSAPTGWQELLAGELDAAAAHADMAAGLHIRPGSRRAIFPGAFDPLHEAHRDMASLAAKRLGLLVEYELSILNVDKPPLDFIEMDRRAGQFEKRETLWFTRAATFVEKAALFQPATFIVGADTIARIADPKYYGGDRRTCEQAIDRIAAASGRFLVFGRLVGGEFQSLSSLELPPPLADLCEEVPAGQFRRDIASTQLRQADG
ncbi:MAG: CinA family protein [Pirellulales bacterium]